MQEFIQKLFRIDRAPAASILITVFVFAIGFVLNGLARLWGQYLTRKKHRKVLLLGLKSLNESLQRNVKVAEVTLTSLVMLNYSHWVYFKPSFYQLRVFTEMGYKDVFQAFFMGIENWLLSLRGKRLKNERMASFNKLFENVARLEGWMDVPFLNFKLFQEDINEFNDKRGVAITSMRKYWERLFTSDPNSLTMDEQDYFRDLSKVLQEYTEIPTEERVNPQVTHEKLVKAIQRLNKQYIPAVDLSEFSDMALEASLQYEQMESYLNGIRQQITEYRDDLKNILASNNTVIKRLD